MLSKGEGTLTFLCLSPLCPFDSRLWFSVCVSFLSFYSLMRMWGSERHYFKRKILTWRYNGKQQQEAFCCISLFVLFKLLGVSLKTLIKHMVGNPLINVHKKKIMYQPTELELRRKTVTYREKSWLNRIGCQFEHFLKVWTCLSCCWVFSLFIIY